MVVGLDFNEREEGEEEYIIAQLKAPDFRGQILWCLNSYIIFENTLNSNLKGTKVCKFTIL